LKGLFKLAGFSAPLFNNTESNSCVLILVETLIDASLMLCVPLWNRKKTVCCHAGFPAIK
jgi:hypothetical protein